jgi:hypothetical protein
MEEDRESSLSLHEIKRKGEYKGRGTKPRPTKQK